MTQGPLFKPDSPRSVEIVVFENVQLLDAAGPLQVFATANDLAHQRGEPTPYALSTIARETPIITSSAGLALVVAPLPSHEEFADTMLVAGGYGVNAAAADEALLVWLKARAPNVRRLASVCSGALLLASAGLLGGRRATTHWTRCDELARRFPDVKVERDPIFIRDGDVWTSAGVTAGIDLALALVEDDLGRNAALAVARQLVVFVKRPGGQAQFSAALALQGGDDRFSMLHGWIALNLAGDLSIPRLAAQAAMSERTFSRQYKRSTGRSPARAIELLRVEAAQRRLCDTLDSIKRIAAVCGFGGEETMRRSFLRIARVGPQNYRDRFSR